MDFLICVSPKGTTTKRNKHRHQLFVERVNVPDEDVAREWIRRTMTGRGLSVDGFEILLVSERDVLVWHSDNTGPTKEVEELAKRSPLFEKKLKRFIRQHQPKTEKQGSGETA